MGNSENIAIYLAPFQGITNAVFRKVYTRHFKGIDKLFTPFFTNIYTKSLHPLKASELQNTIINGVPLVPQILSKEPDEILRFAHYVQDLGFDEINWNLGCPFPRVAKKKRGSGMLPYPGEVKKILDELMPRIPVRFSVKARLGYEQYNEILNLVPVFNDYDISSLTIHARIGKQLYKGDVFLDNFQEILGKCKMPVGYNGDLFSLEDYKRIIERFPSLQIIMLGRGLLVDPFLPEIIKTEQYREEDEAKQILKRFIDDLYFETRKKHQDRLSALNGLKEYWWYFSFSFEKPGKVFNLVKKKKTFDDYEDAVNEVFDVYKWVGSRAKFFKNRQDEE